MNLQQKAQEYKEVSDAITANIQALEYYKQKLHIASISLILLSVKCPDIDNAYKDGTVLKLSRAIEGCKIDMSYGLPILLSFGVKRINTWDELVEVLNEIEE